jgi:hypothetical protein
VHSCLLHRPATDAGALLTPPIQAVFLTPALYQARKGLVRVPVSFRSMDKVPSFTPSPTPTLTPLVSVDQFSGSFHNHIVMAVQGDSADKSFFRHGMQFPKRIWGCMGLSREDSLAERRLEYNSLEVCLA